MIPISVLGKPRSGIRLITAVFLSIAVAPSCLARPIQWVANGKALVYFYGSALWRTDMKGEARPLAWFDGVRKAELMACQDGYVYVLYEKDGTTRLSKYSVDDRLNTAAPVWARTLSGALEHYALRPGCCSSPYHGIIVWDRARNGNLVFGSIPSSMDDGAGGDWSEGKSKDRNRIGCYLFLESGWDYSYSVKLRENSAQNNKAPVGVEFWENGADSLRPHLFDIPADISLTSIEGMASRGYVWLSATRDGQEVTVGLKPGEGNLGITRFVSKYKYFGPGPSHDEFLSKDSRGYVLVDLEDEAKSLAAVYRKIAAMGEAGMGREGDSTAVDLPEFSPDGRLFSVLGRRGVYVCEVGTKVVRRVVTFKM
jgi:hypothetical protein